MWNDVIISQSNSIAKNPINSLSGTLHCKRIRNVAMTVAGFRVTLALRKFLRSHKIAYRIF